MTRKIILALAITAAFVTGSITASGLVFAAPPENNPGQPFQALQAQIDDIQEQIDELTTPATQDIFGFYTRGTLNTPGSSGTLTIECDRGDGAMGGGYIISGEGPQPTITADSLLPSSSPGANQAPDGWFVIAEDVGRDVVINVFVVCADLTA